MGKFKIKSLNPGDKIKLIDLNVNNLESKTEIETVSVQEIEKVMDSVEANAKQAWVFPEIKKDSRVRKLALRSAQRERFMSKEIDRLSEELIRIEEEINESQKQEEKQRLELLSLVNAKHEELEEQLEELHIKIAKKPEILEKKVEVHNTIQHVLDKRLIYFNVSLIILLILTFIFK